MVNELFIEDKDYLFVEDGVFSFSALIPQPRYKDVFFDREYALFAYLTNKGQNCNDVSRLAWQSLKKRCRFFLDYDEIKEKITSSESLLEKLYGDGKNLIFNIDEFGMTDIAAWQKKYWGTENDAVLRDAHVNSGMGKYIFNSKDIPRNWLCSLSKKTDFRYTGWNTYTNVVTCFKARRGELIHLSPSTADRERLKVYV